MRRPGLEDTQPMEPIAAPDASEEPTQFIRRGHVRELDPVEIKRQQSDYQRTAEVYSQEDYAPTPKKQHKGSNNILLKAFVLCTVFLFAMLSGFMISGYQQDKALKEANVKNQQLAAQQQYDSSNNQIQDLEMQRRDLEDKIAALESRQKEAQSKVDKLKGANEQLDKEKKDKSAVEKVLDKATGKAGKQKAEAENNARQQQEAAQELQEIGNALENAQATVHEVNSRIDELEEAGNKALEMKAKAEAAYAENKDTIDSALYYLKLGAQAVGNALN